MLDVPEPWLVIEPAVAGLQSGGVLSAYSPTVPQVQRLHHELRQSKRFADIKAFEVLLREWLADGRSVRPSHRMIGHTGFITVARKIETEEP